MRENVLYVSVKSKELNRNRGVSLCLGFIEIRGSIARTRIVCVCTHDIDEMMGKGGKRYDGEDFVVNQILLCSA